MPLHTFEFPRPEVRVIVPAARSEEQRAQVLQAQRRWAEADQRWRAACTLWSRADEHDRAEWCLYQAAQCEIEQDPEYQRLKAGGQVVTHRL
jgi:hypothetical protein